MKIVVSETSKAVVHRAAVHFSVQTLTGIAMSLCLGTHNENHWSISESLISYFSEMDFLSFSLPKPSIQQFCMVSQNFYLLHAHG